MAACGPTRNIKIRNNIVRGCSEQGIKFSSYVPERFAALNRTIDGGQVRNNILYQNGDNNQVVEEGNVILSGVTQSGNIIDNPDFVSTTSPYDVHLQANVSPGINAGVYAGYPFMGSAPDIGAYDSY